MGHHGNIYTHTDSIAMGSPLGPTLFIFCITYIENKILDNFTKLMIYIQYIHEIFMLEKIDEIKIKLTWKFCSTIYSKEKVRGR